MNRNLSTLSRASVSTQYTQPPPYSDSVYEEDEGMASIIADFVGVQSSACFGVPQENDYAFSRSSLESNHVLPLEERPPQSPYRRQHGSSVSSGRSHMLGYPSPPSTNSSNSPCPVPSPLITPPTPDRPLAISSSSSSHSYASSARSPTSPQFGSYHTSDTSHTQVAGPSRSGHSDTSNFVGLPPQSRCPVSGSYFFASKGYNCMELVSADHPDLVTYRIAVSMNCFNPFSYITSIQRGNGSFVGAFEMGMSTEEEWLSMSTSTYKLSSVFEKFRKVQTKGKDRWKWHRDGIILHWDCRSDPEIVGLQCYSDGGPQLARFLPKPTQAFDIVGRGGRPSPATLQIFTERQSLFDEIVMSLLVAERRRLAPLDAKKGSFSFLGRDA